MSTEEGSLDTGAAERPDTLHADIAAAMEQSEKTETPDVSEAARTLASARKAAAETTATTEVVDPAKAAATTEDPAKAATTTTTEAVEAPQHWPASDREMFAKQTPEARTWLLNRHKAMEADYTRRTQELGSVRRLKEGIDEVFSPFREAMQRDGIDEVAAIKQLVSAHNYLQQSPTEGIKWLAEKYGIDLQQVVAGGTQGTEGQPNAALKPLESKVAEIDKRVSSYLSAQEQQQQKARLEEVSQFADAKDAQGKPLRPHFDEVAKDISRLIKVAREDGEKLSLQDAYDRAIHANPTTRAKVLAAQDAERRAKEEAERKAKADAAKKASAGNVTGQGATTSVVAKTDSVREDLEAAFAVSGARV